MELREFDNNYRQKSEDFKLQINQHQNEDEKKIIIINNKEKNIFDLKNEINKLNSILDEKNDDIKDLHIDLQDKDNIINKLNTDLNNFLNDLKIYEFKLRNYDEMFEKSKQEYKEKIHMTNLEKDKVIAENKLLQDEIAKLRKKIIDINNYYSNKKKDIALETNDIIEQNNMDIMKNFSFKEEKLQMDILNLQKLLAEKERQKDDIVIKLENKMHRVIFFIFWFYK